MSYIDEVKKNPYVLDVWQKELEIRPDDSFLVDVGQGKKFTYKECNEISGKIYAFLKGRNIGKEDFVLINLPRGASAIIAMIGVWKAGAAFVVTENTMAPERISFIHDDCSCKVTIDTEVWEEILDCKPLLGYEKTDEHDAAFAVYTSGSTGNPKGVVHEYGSLRLLRYTSGWNEEYIKNSEVNYGLIAPLNFVASVEILTLKLYKHSCIYILPYSIIKNPVKLLEYYRDNHIYEAYLPPSYIRVLGDKLKDYLKIVHTGSEPANGIYVEGVRILNKYSMSEIPVILSSFLLDKKYDVAPIGKLDNGIPHYLIDEDGKEIKDNSIGELCFDVPYTRGYINLPEQTKKVFVNGIYHTGDLAHRMSGGNYVLDGRSTDMIKINGNRIEPAEIEAAFKKIVGVDWCAAKGIEEKRRSYVCLYYIDNIDFDEDAVNKKMQDSLPSYMIPAYYYKIDKIPFKASGKFDRKALPIPEIHDYRQEYIAPTDDVEKLLCAAFAKALNIDEKTISIKDDFYKLGGDSIATMHVVVCVDSLELSAKDIFKYKTIEKLASLVRERKIELSESLDKQLENELKVPHKLNAMQVNIFDRQLYKVKGTMWNLPFFHRFDKSVSCIKLKESVEKVINAHPILSCFIRFDKNNELIFEYKPEMIQNIEINTTTEEELKNIKETLIKPFKLLKSPLFRCSIFETEKYNYLFWDMQHIISDGTTVSIILSDLEKAYFGDELEKDYYWLELSRIEKLKDKIQQNKEFFGTKYSGVDWYTIPQPDYESRDSSGKKWFGNLSLKEIDLVAAEKKYNVTRNVIAIAAGLVALSKYSNKNEVMTNWIYNNRTTKNSMNYVGLMIKTLPVGVCMNRLKNTSDLLKEVKTQVNEGILNCDYDYFTEYESIFNSDHMEVNYVGNIDFSKFGKKLKYESVELMHKDSNATARLEIDIWQGDNGEISVIASYLEKIYKEENINNFMNLYVEAFNNIVKL